MQPQPVTALADFPLGAPKRTKSGRAVRESQNQLVYAGLMLQDDFHLLSHLTL